MNSNKILLILSLSLSILLANKAFANEETPPPSITVKSYSAPNAVLALNKAYLVYELYLTNYMQTPMTLRSLDVSEGSRQFSFAPKDFAKSIQTINPKNKNQPYLFQPGESKIIFLWYVFEDLSKVPEQLKHEFKFDSKDGKKYTLDYPNLLVDKKPPVIVGAPLRGSNWQAGNGLANASIHRRSAMYFDGRSYFPERYAIDFVRVGPDGQTFKGDEYKNQSYEAYNQDLLAVAEGKVVAVKDGLPENIPHSDKLAVELSVDSIAGNFIILELEQGVYAAYAHLIPGSLKVNVGDSVTRGQVLAKLGNSGNSSEPHLHFQLMDKPSMLAANGIPYGFDRFSVIPSLIEGNKVKRLAEKPMVYLNQLPLKDLLIDFENASSD